MNKNNIFIIGIILLLFLVGFGTASIIFRSARLGGLFHVSQETFVSGIDLGAADEAPCVKIYDTDGGGWSYVTVLNGVMTTTGGAAGAFTIPTGCAGK